jgi:hypothetical protein
MQIKNYWVGDRPGGAWTFQVLNQRSGAPESLATFRTARVVMVDSDNNRIEFPTDNVAISDPANGVVTFLWPDGSPFPKAGRYVIQLELENTTTLRRTTVQEILVRELGGVTK